MDIELRQQYTDEDIAWEHKGAAKAVGLLLAMLAGAGFTLWLLITILFSYMEAV